jgi:peptide/nickel transport system permease protein
MILLIVLACVVTFTLAVNSPIDPIRQYIGTGTITEEQREAIEEYWGLNDTKIERFIKLSKNLLHGDFGKSVIFRKSVISVIAERTGSSIFLMVSTFILTGVLGYFMGLFMGRYRDSIGDRIFKSICIVFTATPNFWVGILMLIVFSLKLGIFPIGFSMPIGVATEDVSILDRIYHAILPIITLTLVFIPNIALHTRSKVIEALESDYVLFAKARGDSEKSIMKNHVIKNTVLPAVTIHFGSFSEIFGGSILAENVFSYPGLGSTIVNAGLRGDIPLLLGITIIISIFVFIGNFTSDILHLVINPVIREEGI